MLPERIGSVVNSSVNLFFEVATYGYATVNGTVLFLLIASFIHCFLPSSRALPVPTMLVRMLCKPSVGKRANVIGSACNSSVDASCRYVAPIDDSAQRK